MKQAPKVYFFGTLDGAYIKIGWTSGALADRKKEILRGQLSNVGLVLLVAVPGSKTQEKEVRIHFRGCRAEVNSTETFTPRPELLEYINWLRQQWWVYLTEEDHVDAYPSWLEWRPSPAGRRVGFLKEDPLDLIPRHITYRGPLAGTPWNKLSTPTPASGEDFYTPPEIVEAARVAMGGIDLDAASHWFANRTHKIPEYFHHGRSAFDNRWRGNVWLNPPYGENAPWFKEILKYLESGELNRICMISPVWAFTTIQARPIMARSSAMVLLSPTPQFWGHPGGNKGTNHPHAVIYIGDNPGRFIAAFERFGIPITIAYRGSIAEPPVALVDGR